MKDLLTRTISIAGQDVPLWVPVAAGIALLLIFALTGEGPGSSDWVGPNNEG